VTASAKPRYGADDLTHLEGLEAVRKRPGMVGATWLTDGAETLAFVSSDSSLLRFAASLVRPQGLRGGGMAGINLPAGAEVVFFGAVRTDDNGHGEPMVVTSTGRGVKVTPFAAYPAKGRATGGVRSQRFLRGEHRLVLAWIGPRPVGTANNGSAIELPGVASRRDGPGHAHLSRPGRGRPPDRTRLSNATHRPTCRRLGLWGCSYASGLAMIVRCLALIVPRPITRGRLCWW
jgi:hypothetical protein